MNTGYTGDSLIVLWDSSLVVYAHLFHLAAHDSHTNYLLFCSGESEMFSVPLLAAGGTGNLMSKPQLTCVPDVTGSLVQFLDCVDTLRVDPAGETTIKRKFIPLAKVHSNLEGCSVFLWNVDTQVTQCHTPHYRLNIQCCENLNSHTPDHKYCSDTCDICLGTF